MLTNFGGQRTSDKIDNWGMVALIGFTIFIVLLVGAGFAQYYKEVVNMGPLGEYPRYPYQEYTVPLVIGAILGLIIGLGGFFAPEQTKEKKPDQTTILIAKGTQEIGVSQIKCGTCGTMNDLDSVYCKKCARKFL